MSDPTCDIIVNVELTGASPAATVTLPYLGFQTDPAVYATDQELIATGNYLLSLTGDYCRIDESRFFRLTNNFGISGDINLTGKILQGGKSAFDSLIITTGSSINNLLLSKYENTITGGLYGLVCEINLLNNSSTVGTAGVTSFACVNNLGSSGTGVNILVASSFTNFVRSGTNIYQNLFAYAGSNLIDNSTIRNCYGGTSTNALVNNAIISNNLHGHHILNSYVNGTISGNSYGILIDAGGNGVSVVGQRYGIRINNQSSGTNSISIFGASDQTGNYLNIIDSNNKNIVTINSGGGLNLVDDINDPFLTGIFLINNLDSKNIFFNINSGSRLASANSVFIQLNSGFASKNVSYTINCANYHTSGYMLQLEGARLQCFVDSGNVTNQVIGLLSSAQMKTGSIKHLIGFDTSTIIFKGDTSGDIKGINIVNLLLGGTFSGKMYGIHMLPDFSSISTTGSFYGMYIDMRNAKTNGISIKSPSNYTGNYLEILNNNETKLFTINSGAMAILPKLAMTGTTPPSSSGSLGIKGELAYDTGYFYICINDNSWKKIALIDI